MVCGLNLLHAIVLVVQRHRWWINYKCASKVGDDEQGISSHRVPARGGDVIFTCSRPNIAKLASEFALQKLGMGPIKDEVVRTYEFKNVNYYANIVVNVFKINADSRTQIMQFSASSSFKKHIQDKDSFINVRAASQGYSLILPIVSSVPVLPVPERSIAVIDATNLDQAFQNGLKTIQVHQKNYLLKKNNLLFQIL